MYSVYLLYGSCCTLLTQLGVIPSRQRHFRNWHLRFDESLGSIPGRPIFAAGNSCINMLAVGLEISGWDQCSLKWETVWSVL
jgi:hypothetical protein